MVATAPRALGDVWARSATSAIGAVTVASVALVSPARADGSVAGDWPEGVWSEDPPSLTSPASSELSPDFPCVGSSGVSRELVVSASRGGAPLDASAGPASAGGASTAGTSTGGASTGGASTTGTSTGASTGGTSTAGTSTGGASTGGTSAAGTSAGTSTGEPSTGGAWTGGTSTAGTSTGGTSTAGTSTDGTSTVGTSTGVSTGGASTAGTSTGVSTLVGGACSPLPPSGASPPAPPPSCAGCCVSCEVPALGSCPSSDASACAPAASRSVASKARTNALKQKRRCFPEVWSIRPRGTLCQTIKNLLPNG